MKVTGATPEYDLIAPKEAIIAWKQNPVTRQIMAIVDQELETSYHRVGNGETLTENTERDTGRAVGYIEGLTFIRNIEQLINQIEDAEDAEDERREKGKKGSNPVR